jgi:hypothetical protein
MGESMVVAHIVRGLCEKSQGAEAVSAYLLELENVGCLLPLPNAKGEDEKEMAKLVRSLEALPALLESLPSSSAMGTGESALGSEGANSITVDISLIATADAALDWLLLIVEPILSDSGKPSGISPMDVGVDAAAHYGVPSAPELGWLSHAHFIRALNVVMGAAPLMRYVSLILHYVYVPRHLVLRLFESAGVNNMNARHRPVAEMLAAAINCALPASNASTGSISRIPPPRLWNNAFAWSGMEVVATILAQKVETCAHSQTAHRETNALHNKSVETRNAPKREYNV